MTRTKSPKKPAKKSPTARALELYRDLGFRIEKVEQRLAIPGKSVTRDLFNVIDLIAIKPGVGIVGVQATGGEGGNHAARRNKAKAEPALREWLESGGRFEVVSFAKRCSNGRGSRKVVTPRREELTLEQLDTP